MDREIIEDELTRHIGKVLKKSGDLQHDKIAYHPFNEHVSLQDFWEKEFSEIADETSFQEAWPLDLDNTACLTFG